MGRKKKPESEKVSKPGVSLTPECREILRRVLDYELNVHRNEFSHSKIVQKCLRLAWEKHYQPLCDQHARDFTANMLYEGNFDTQPHSGEGATNPRKTSDGGLKTRSVKYLPARAARSSK